MNKRVLEWVLSKAGENQIVVSKRPNINAQISQSRFSSCVKSSGYNEDRDLALRTLRFGSREDRSSSTSGHDGIIGWDLPDFTSAINN